jgi:hypothetical protein
MGVRHHQELKTWGSATPEAPSAAATLAKDHMRCGGILPEILRQLQSHSRQFRSALGTIMVVIPGMETFLRDKMTASYCTAFNVRAKECSHDIILIANQISGKDIRQNVVNNG